MTQEELEKSILSGDQQKQDHMRYLIQALPFHSDDVVTVEELLSRAATTVAPSIEPIVPLELKKLFNDFGLLDKDGKPIELNPLPLTSDQDSLVSHSLNGTPDMDPISLEELQEQVKKASVVKGKDYEEFKPIGEGNKNVSSDMELFLKQFGLGGSTVRPKQQKSSKNTREQSIKSPTPSSSFLIPGYSSLLDNIGITNLNNGKSGKRVNAKVQTNVPKSNQKKKGAEEDYEKLESLLDTIRELERLNASLTEKEIDRLNLRNFNFSESLLSTGPDPLDQIHFSALKNEVKRQNPSEPTKLSLELTGPLLESSLEATDDKSSSTTTSDSTEKPSTTTSRPSTTSTTSTTTSAPKEEERKNSLEDEIEPIDDPEPLPPPRRSGFYMLFDWNSFLEVGEEEKIVVRFDPKIGDPSRFLPVNVP